MPITFSTKEILHFLALKPTSISRRSNEAQSYQIVKQQRPKKKSVCKKNKSISRKLEAENWKMHHSDDDEKMPGNG